jgi:adenylate kinase
MNQKTILFFGIVGAGKGTQVELLQQYFNEQNHSSLYIYPGNEYRKISSQDTYISKQVKETLDKGNLQPDALTDGLVVSLLMDRYTGAEILIFDGYPRSLRQSETLADILKFYSINELTVLLINISEEEAVKRMMARGRSDDNVEAIQKRINVYKEQVYPSLAHLEKFISVTVHTINGEQTIEQVHADIKNALALK